MGKKYLANPFSIPAISLALLAATACGRESACRQPVAAKKEYRSLLGEFALAEKIGLPLAIAMDRPEHGQHFVTGWGPPESGLRRAMGKESVVAFEAARAQDLRLHIEGRSLPGRAQDSRNIEVLLNSRPLAAVEPSPQLRSHSLLLPKETLRVGRNVLAFRFGGDRDSRAAGKQGERRPPGFSFKRLELHPALAGAFRPPEPKRRNADGGIVHYPGSAFAYFLKPSACEVLEARITRLPANTEAHVRLTSDAGRRQELVFSKPGKKGIRLRPFADRPLKLLFYLLAADPASAPARDYAVWSEIGVLATATKKKAREPEALRKLRTSEWDVVYVVLDAFHARHASLYGYPRETTPFLKKIGGRGAVFENFFANSPYTLASTGTLFTSRYPHEHGLIDEGDELNPQIPTLAEILSQRSVSTSIITGYPWFMGDWGLSRGFSEPFFMKADVRAGRFASSLKKLYQGSGGGRKFIYIHAHPPHAPYLPPRRFRVFPLPAGVSFRPTPQNFRKIEDGEIPATDDLLDFIEAMYDANILYADRLAEEIHGFFSANGLLDRTVFIFTSDHGDACRMQHGKLGHNSTLFQEMTHIPFVMLFPERLHVPPVRVRSPFSVVDSFATILDLFGVPEVPGQRGRSFLPAVVSPETEPGRVYLENLFVPGGQKAVVEYPFKFITAQEGERLFDLRNDYGEQYSLLPSLPVAAGYFRQLIRLHQGGGIPPGGSARRKAIDAGTLARLKTLGYLQ